MASSWPWATIPINLLTPLVAISVAQGTLNQLWAATSKDVKSGKYYVPVAKENPGSAQAQDTKLASKLWNWTEDELNKFLKDNSI